MTDFLGQAFAGSPPGDPVAWLVSLVAAAAFGACIAWVYRVTRRGGGASPTFSATLVLLAILIAMATQVIGDNVARAFSLVGALSIVRFRTVVRDTQDTAFVIFSVVIGMALGAHNLVMASIGLVVVGAAAFVMRQRAPIAGVQSARFVLNLRVGLVPDIEALVGPTLDAYMSERHQVSVVTARQGLSVEVAYEGRLKTPARSDALVMALNRLDGMQRVELTRRQAPDDEGPPS